MWIVGVAERDSLGEDVFVVLSLSTITLGVQKVDNWTVVVSLLTCSTKIMIL